VSFCARFWFCAISVLSLCCFCAISVLFCAVSVLVLCLFGAALACAFVQRREAARPECAGRVQEVEAMHRKYVERLRELYIAHRHLHPQYRDRDLELW
jgi:hypothetical protein